MSVIKKNSRWYILGAQWMCWLSLFLTSKIIFAGYQLYRNDYQVLDKKNVLLALFHGLRMDISMATYLSILPFLILTICEDVKLMMKVLNGYFVTILCVITFLLVADMELFHAWKSKLDIQSFMYLQNPKEALASASSAPVLLLTTLVAGLIIAHYKIYRGIIKGITFQSDRWSVLLLLPLMVVAMRGGLGIAPMNPSAAYFSKENIYNQIATNTIWNCMHSVSKNKVSSNPYVSMSTLEMKDICDQLLIKQSPSASFKLPEGTNVLFIIWESLTAKVVDKSYNGVEILPHFNQLKKEGIWCSKAYASGDRTEKGLAAILSGYPAQPITSIVKVTSKAATLPNIAHSMKSQGYSCNFYYGGDLEFANIKAYLYNGGFDNIVSKEDFAPRLIASKWGLHDDLLLDYYYHDRISDVSRRLDVVLTLSSHEPFDVPMDPIIIGDSDEAKFYNSLAYTDKSISAFIGHLKASKYWANTLVVITGDHGHPIPYASDRGEDFKIPIVFTGGVVPMPNEVSYATSQIDITYSVLEMLGISHKLFTFSKSLFSSPHWAYFTYKDGFGMVTDTCDITFDNLGGSEVVDYGCEDELKLGKAFLQYSFDDYLSRH